MIDFFSLKHIPLSKIRLPVVNVLSLFLCKNTHLIYIEGKLHAKHRRVVSYKRIYLSIRDTIWIEWHYQNCVFVYYIYGAFFKWTLRTSRFLRFKPGTHRDPFSRTFDLKGDLLKWIFCQILYLVQVATVLDLDIYIKTIIISARRFNTSHSRSCSFLAGLSLCWCTHVIYIIF